MAKPFTSLDGTDANGVRAEVHVQTGTGKVKSLVESGNNVNVFMEVEGLKHPVSGWTSKSENIYPMLVEAHSQGREFTYRIESQRKNGIDRKTPLADLRPNMEVAKENTRNLFVGIDSTYSSEMVTNPAEDPHAGGRVPATDPRNAPAAAAPTSTGGGFSAQQALTGLANARHGGLPASVVDAASALALAAGASVEQVLAAGFDAQQGEQGPREVRRAVAAEGKPFVAINTDGRVNIGSYAVQAACGAESLAAELMRQNAAEVAEAHNAGVAAGEVEGDLVEPQPVNFKNAAALGALLLSLADRVQVALSGANRPDRMATSHSRSRSFVYDAVKNRYPVPFGQDAEAQEAWKVQVVEESVSRFKFAVKIAMEIPDIPRPQNVEQTEEGNQSNAQGPVRQPAAQAAPQNQQGGQAPQNQQAERPKVPVEGDEGFVAPTQETLDRFAALALAAGFEPNPDSPIIAYLTVTFGVANARKVNGDALVQMLNWYDSKGVSEAPLLFAQRVNTTVGAPAA